MNDLICNIAANIRYVDNSNGTVTLRKSDFESLVQRLSKCENILNELQDEWTKSIESKILNGDDNGEPIGLL